MGKHEATIKEICQTKNKGGVDRWHQGLLDDIDSRSLPKYIGRVQKVLPAVIAKDEKATGF